MVQRRGYAEWVKKNETFQLVGMDQLNRLIANVFNTSNMPKRDHRSHNGLDGKLGQFFKTGQ